MALAALTRDRVLHYLPRQVKFYSLSFRVIDIKRLFQRHKLLYYLGRYLLTEDGGLVNDINISKHGGRERVSSKKNDAGASCPKFHRASYQLQDIAYFEIKIVSNFI